MFTRDFILQINQCNTYLYLTHVTTLSDTWRTTHPPTRVLLHPHFLRQKEVYPADQGRGLGSLRLLFELAREAWPRPGCFYTLQWQCSYHHTCSTMSHVTAEQMAMADSNSNVAGTFNVKMAPHQHFKKNIFIYYKIIKKSIKRFIF